MPLYKVIAPGFHKGKMYSPEGKRKTVHMDKPFTKGKNGKNPMPSWLSEMPEENAAQKKKREAYEAIAEANAEEKAENDKKDIANASTQGGGENTAQGVDGKTSFLEKAAGAVKNVVTGGGKNVETI